jgi:hypothetical protein
LIAEERSRRKSRKIVRSTQGVMTGSVQTGNSSGHFSVPQTPGSGARSIAQSTMIWKSVISSKDARKITLNKKQWHRSKSRAEVSTVTLAMKKNSMPRKQQQLGSAGQHVW